MRHLATRASGGLIDTWFRVWETYYMLLERGVCALTSQPKNRG